MSNTVRPYITKDEPCGPLDSIDIDSKDVALSQDNELCVHPLFSRIFHGNGRERPVYPYGSVLDDEDYRDNVD